MSEVSILPLFADLKINPRTNAWGPTGIPEEFKNMPFQPFSKETRLDRYTSQFGGGGQYSYYHDDDDVNFQTVSSAKLVKNNYIRNRQRFLNIKNRKMSNSNVQQFQVKKKIDARMPQNNRKMPPHFNNNKSKMAYNRQDPRNQKGRVNRAPSINIKDHWLQVDEIELSRLTKLILPNVKPPCDAGDFGFLEFYDPDCDTISVKNEKKLCDQHCDSQCCELTNDEVLHKMASCKLAKVYMTSTVAEVLMCSPKSVYPWDLTVIRAEDSVLIDIREDSSLAYVTVGETSPDPPLEDNGVNGVKNLSIEATLINLRLKRHFLKAGKKFSLPHKHPSPLGNYSDDECDEPKNDPAIGFRYRIFDLGGINVMIRCQVDGVLPGSKKKAKFINIHALNETMVKGPNFGDWRSKLDSQKGAVVANELKHNAFKLSRWTCGAILSDVDQIKFGFVSRVTPKENKKHVILGTQQFQPNDFAQQINFSIDNGFGILKCILEHLLRLPVGKYIVMKDPNKSIIRILTTSSRVNSSQEESSDEKQGEEDLLVDEATVRKNNLKTKAESRLAKINDSLGNHKWTQFVTPF